MILKTIPFQHYEQGLPQSGHHILAQQKKESLIVYQAFNPRIASYAIEHQVFGGSAYNFGRMSWIKPNFLWMMYRCGWASKEAQKRVLAIEISKANFDQILAKAIHSSFKADIYSTKENWQQAIKKSNVRLQWDPDHNPYGNKLDRRAIQLGLRGKMLRQFATDWIISIEDITDFVLTQGERVVSKDLANLMVMEEEVYLVKDAETKEKLRINEYL